MIKHFVVSRSAVTACFQDYSTLSAPKCADKNDRPSWEALNRRLAVKRFQSIRQFAEERGIPVYD